MKGAASALLLALPAVLFSAGSFAAEDSCGPVVVEYVTVDPLHIAEVAAATPTQTASASATPQPTKTTTLGPIADPHVDTSNPANIVPAKNVSIYYGSSSSADPSLLNMTLEMNHPTVILEYIQSVVKVDCSNDSVAVTFGNLGSYQNAVKQWTLDHNFIIVTNHMGDCDAEFERGFFLVDRLISTSSNQTIVAKASKTQLDKLAYNGEFSFSSLPATALAKRLTLDPSTSLTIADSLPNNTVILDISPYLEITANEAYFTSTITFSGYLNYNFWGFKLKEFYFDLDTSFTADVEISAGVAAAYSTSYNYAPSDLVYNAVSVPGILDLGPGIKFAVGVNLNASAAVNATAGLGISLPNGNVHLDVLDQSRNSATGWEPTYTSYANISEKAEVDIDPSASITIELAFKLLGGLIDLTSGITAAPGFKNHFALNAVEVLNATTNGTAFTLPDGESCDQGVELKSNFTLDVSAFATQWWSDDLYSVSVPLWDYCYEWV